MSETDPNNDEPTAALLNTIEISPNIECISFKSLYGFVFKIKLVKLQTGTQSNGTAKYKDSYYTIENMHNKAKKEYVSNRPTHIIIKFVLVTSDTETALQEYTDPRDGKKYKKRSNTNTEFENEVNNQIDIYEKTLGQNCIAICPKIFHYKLFHNADAINFLDFFDKNVSDDTSTNLIDYLKTNVKDKQLGLIAMEYVQTAKKTNEPDGYKRDDRVTLYNFLIKQPYETGPQQDEIIKKMIELLPTLKKKPDYLYNTFSLYNEQQSDRQSRSKTIQPPITASEKAKQNEQYELDDLERNFFKYRIVAHIIYYMIKAYLAGYIHTDLHAGNIYVLNVTESFNTCIHPFSLNDVGNYQLGDYTIALSSYFTNYNAGNIDCGKIQNFCNMSCIEIIDWGRTTQLTNQQVKFTENTTFEELIGIINTLKTHYDKFSYLFNLVGLSDDISTDTTEIPYPQFYVLWLIYNELKFKTKIQTDVDCSNKSKSTEEIDDTNLNKYLNEFDQRCTSDPFYKIFTLHAIVE
jgi:hypothetical protein